jgi:XRE family aerobic/anaerobic benzoate catabolism transcriptional regulator
VPKARTLRILADLGLRVVELREARGLTQEELAELTGLSPRQMQRVEAGEANLAVVMLAELARALRCSVADLFGPTTRRIKRRPGRPKAR